MIIDPVVLATLLAVARASHKHLVDQQVVIFGAGSTGCSIAEQIVRGMVHDGLTEHEARGRVHMINRVGLLPIQNRLLQPRKRSCLGQLTGDRQSA